MLLAWLLQVPRWAQKQDGGCQTRFDLEEIEIPAESRKRRGHFNLGMRMEKGRCYVAEEQ